LAEVSEGQFNLDIDWNLNKSNLYQFYEASCQKEFERLRARRAAPVSTLKDFIRYKFNKHQTSVLNYITRKGWLKDFLDSRGGVPPSMEVGGKPTYLAEPERGREGIARRRGSMAPLWGYGPHDTELIMDGGVNLNSSTHWKKAKYLRWMQVYRYCTQIVGGRLDIYNMADWAEAAKTLDEDTGHTSIWDIVRDTG